MNRKAIELCDSYHNFDLAISDASWIDDNDEYTSVVKEMEKQQEKIVKELTSIIIEADKNGELFDLRSVRPTDLRRILIDDKYVISFFDENWKDGFLLLAIDSIDEFYI